MNNFNLKKCLLCFFVLSVHRRMRRGGGGGGVGEGAVSPRKFCGDLDLLAKCVTL